MCPLRTGGYFFDIFSSRVEYPQNIDSAMIRKYGGQKVPKGFYWNTKTWRISQIDEEAGGSLPGEPNILYLRMNILELIFLSLTLGALYVLFVPFVGYVIVLVTLFVGVATFIAQKVICYILKSLCNVDRWICDITEKYLCKKCGKECTDHVTMAVKALVFAIVSFFIFVAGILYQKYIIAVNPFNLLG